MTAPAGDYQAEVQDTGGHYVGSQLCSNFTTSGWTENLGAEQSASAGAAASAASSSAGARASQDQATASTLTARVEQDADFSKDLSALASDVQTIDKDLAATRSAATGGQGDNCYNLTSNVSYDATADVAYDASSGIEYDSNSLHTDIQSARDDLTQLANVLAALQADGLGAPASAASASTTLRSTIQSAITKTNGYIDHANGNVQQAYAIANGLATGNCAGDGPGQAPEPIAHLN